MSGDAGRVVYAGLHLLDRQLLDREKRPCGNVDDLELVQDEGTGNLYVTAVLTGPGVLAYRLGWRRLGPWMHQVNRLMWGGRSERGDGSDPNRVPMELVSDIEDHVDLGADRSDVGTWSLDDWARRHIIRHIPGSGYADE
jgi:hypothetical protein